MAAFEVKKEEKNIWKREPIRNILLGRIFWKEMLFKYQ